MHSDRHITLFHNPQSRSRGVLVLLEELGADYSLQRLDLERGDQRDAAFLAINPMGKIPAITHGDSVVTEQAAIYQYLAELYPDAGLSPAPGDPDRGAYLRWLAFYGSAFEPALIDKAMKRDAPPRSLSPWADFPTVLAVVDAQLAQGDYLARRTLFRRRRAVGQRAGLDGRLQDDRPTCPDPGLHCTHSRAASGGAGRGGGRRRLTATGAA